jgi:hypothetical protein
MSSYPAALPGSVAHPIDKVMARGGKDSLTQPGDRKGDAARADRLRAALRENLRRRKSQARGRSQAGESRGTHDSAGIVQETASDKTKE